MVKEVVWLHHRNATLILFLTLAPVLVCRHIEIRAYQGSDIFGQWMQIKLNLTFWNMGAKVQVTRAGFYVDTTYSKKTFVLFRLFRWLNFLFLFDRFKQRYNITTYKRDRLTAAYKDPLLGFKLTTSWTWVASHDH